MEMCCIVDKKIENVYCQLQNVEVTANIDGMIAEVTVYQKYQNISKLNIDALFTFPLVNQSKITGFLAKIESTEIEGEFRSIEEVHKEFDKAVRKGENSYLLENYKENVFQIGIGDVMPGEKVDIAISYIEEINIKNNEINWKLPVFLAPKRIYGKKTNKLNYIDNDFSSNDDMRNIYKNLNESTHTLKITVTINGLHYIKLIESSSHQVSISMARDFYIVRLARHNVHLENDFLLKIKLEKIGTNDLSVALTEEDEVFVEANFTFELDKYVKRNYEYIFLLDISSSMHGEKFNRAKEVLESFLSNLISGDYFDVIGFESYYRILSKNSLSFNEENYDRALKWINNLKCCGEKELFDIMYYLLEGVKPQSELGKVIILITDGEVEDELEIINMVNNYSDLVNIFTFGIDAVNNKSFIDGIAIASNGGSEYIESNKAYEKIVLTQFNRIHFPMAKFKGITDNYGNEIKFIPKLKSDLYFFNTYNILIKTTSDEYLERLANINISVDIDGEEFELQLFKTGKGNSRLLSIKWARKKIEELEKQLFGMDGTKKEEIKKEIEFLSTKYRVTSSETSLIAISERIENLESKEYILIPVSKPASWKILNEDQMFDSSLNNRFEIKNAKVDYELESKIKNQNNIEEKQLQNTIARYNKPNRDNKPRCKFLSFIKSFIYKKNKDLTDDKVQENDVSSKDTFSKLNYKKSENALPHDLTETINNIVSEQNIDGSFGNVENSNYRTSCFVIAMLLLENEVTIKFKDKIAHAGTSLLSGVDNDILFKSIALFMLIDREILRESDMYKNRDGSYKYVGDYKNYMLSKLNILERQSFEDFKSLKGFDINSLIQSFLKAVNE
ncbi:MAG: VIT and VWA domain-containing protein [Clostridiales bacterium]